MSLRRVALVLWLLVTVSAHAALDERIAVRYKQLLAGNPTEGAALDRLWEMYQQNGATAQLLEEYRAARETFAGAMIYGHLLRKAGRAADARPEFDRAAKIDPASPAPHLALAAAHEGEPRATAAELEKAASIFPASDPKKIDVLLKLGDAWLAANDPGRATGAWEQMIALDPSNIALRSRLADNYEKNGVGKKAAEHFQYITEHGEPAQRAQAWQSLARIQQARGDQDAAIAALEQGLALTAPGNWLRLQLQDQLIRLHQRYGRTAELEQKWKEAVAQNPRDLTGYLRLVDLFEHAGDLSGQREWLEKLVQLAPKNREAQLKLARVAVQLNDLERATALFDALLREQPGDPELVFARAELDLQQDALQAAKARIETFLASPFQSEATRFRALEFYRKHRLFDMVERHLQKDQSDDGAIALAAFYFEQRRPEDSARTLTRLVHSSDSPEKRAAAYARIAQILKDQGRTAAGLEAIQHAVTLQPRAPELQLFLSELLLAENRFDEAKDAIELARSLSTDPAARLAADQKLFQLFQTRSAQRTASSTPLFDPKGRIDLLSIPFLRGANDSAENPMLDKYLDGLTREAVDHPSTAAFLRAAQWRFWNRDYKEALDFAQRAIEREPGQLEARELAVKAATGTGQKAVALAQLRELVRLEPKPARLREIGRAELQLGHTDEALRIFEDLARTNPGDLETISDLAMAQQQADRWPDALETWQQAYRAAPSPRKREMLQPLLRVLERLQMHQKAAELLLKAIDDQPDENARASLLQDLIGTAARHDLLPWLQTQIEARQRARPDDSFAILALAKILKAAGHEEDAFALLHDASYAGPTDPASLQELVREAETLGRLDQAIQHQQRLVASSPAPDASTLQKLAELQEANLDVEAAQRTWERIVRVFPRDPAALSRAATFYAQWNLDDRAREILRKTRVIDPTDLAALNTLARLALTAGESAEALSCYQQVLENSEPELPGDPPKFPATNGIDLRKLQSSYLMALHARRARPRIDTMRAFRSFWGSETDKPSNPREFRLAAIRGISEILRAQGGEAFRSWLSRWDRSNAQSEPLWAFFYGGAADQAFAKVSEMMRKAPDDAPVREGFVWIALQMREYTRLSRWVADRTRTAAERDVFLVAFEQFLNSRNKPDPGLVPGLFPPEFDLPDLLWQAAVKLAARNCFEEATQLGQRVFENAVAQRSAYALDLANWHLVLGDADRARRVLRVALAETGDSFDQAPYAALRQYFGLLSEPERASFAQQFTASVNRSRNPIHAAIALSVLHALRGDQKAAQAELVRLLDLRAAPPRSGDDGPNAGAYRFWTFVLAGGLQLQTWKFGSLATFWWERALADSAAVKLQGDAALAVAREIQIRLLADRLTRSTPTEAEMFATEFTRKMAVDVTATLSSVLESSGVPGRATAIYRALWHRDLQNQQFLRGLLAASRSSGDVDAAEEALREAVSTGPTGPNPALYRESLAQLVDLLENRGALSEAQRLVEQALHSAPDDPVWLDRMARLHLRRGQIDLAENVRRRLLEMDLNNTGSRLGLASLLEQTGRIAEAIDLVTGCKDPARTSDVDLRLFDLQLKNNDPARAVAALERMTRTGSFANVAASAPRLAKAGERSAAQRLVQSAINQCKDVRQRFALRLTLIELLRDAANNGALVDRELRRLRAAADEMTDLQPAYFEAISKHSDAARELLEAWNSGEGPLAAGGQLFRLALERQDQDEASSIAAGLLAHPEANEQTFAVLSERAARAKRPDLAAQFAEARCQQSALDIRAFIDLAMKLNAAGRKADAVAALERVGLRHVVSDDVAPLVAQAYLDLGETERAKGFLIEALKNDPQARNFPVYLRAARVLLAAGETTGARGLLRAAFRNPANSEFGELVHFYAATNALDRLGKEERDFQFSGERLCKLWAAVIAHHCQAQQFQAAIDVATAHPSVVALKGEVRATLRTAAASGDRFEETARLLEDVLRQGAGDAPEIAPDLALLYFDWAQRDLASGRNEPGLEHLVRAQKLAPAHFGIAERLSTLQRERNDRTGARAVLDAFLRASRQPSERDQAKELLRRLD